MRQIISRADSDDMDAESEFDAAVENTEIKASCRVYDRNSRTTIDLYRDVRKDGSS